MFEHTVIVIDILEMVDRQDVTRCTPTLNAAPVLSNVILTERRTHRLQGALIVNYPQCQEGDAGDFCHAFGAGLEYPFNHILVGVTHRVGVVPAGVVARPGAPHHDTLVARIVVQAFESLEANGAGFDQQVVTVAGHSVAVEGFGMELHCLLSLFGCIHYSRSLGFGQPFS